MEHPVIGSDDDHLCPIPVSLIETFTPIATQIEALVDEKARGFSNDDGIGMEDIPQFPISQLCPISILINIVSIHSPSEMIDDI
jgi:hypothetical protein